MLRPSVTILSAQALRGGGDQGTGHRSCKGQDGRMPQGAALGVDEIVAVLASGADWPLGPGVAVTQLEHALQTAAALRRDEPDDDELAVAGLVHDLGQLLAGARDKTHAADGAAAVRVVLGERVAGIVALHVEAKRYLVAVDGNYTARLAGDSVVSLGRQGGALDGAGAAAFLRRPWAADAVTLRRADDGGKADGLGLVVEGLEAWVPLLRLVSEHSGGADRRQRARRLSTVGRRPDGRSGRHSAGGVQV